jgi:hypothetical protein
MLSSKDGCSTGARAHGRSDQYLTKPFTKESLLKAVATTSTGLPRRGRAAEAAARLRSEPT